MLNYVHSPTWRTKFAALEQALGVVERKPTLFDTAVRRWSRSEPALAGLRASYLFEGPGRLSEPQARALIRAARSSDLDADLAAWTLIYQFVNPIIAVVETAEKRYGQPPGESVDTAIADLFTSIHRINLETNTASIFFALSRMMWKAVLRPQARFLDHSTFVPYLGECDDSSHGLAADPETDLVDWECTIDSLTDFLADDLVDALGWSRENRYFARRQARLRAFVAYRVSEAATGEHASATAIAGRLGESTDMIKELQAAVNKVWASRADHYRASVAGLLGQAA